jgi:hypothetical protein
MEDYIFLIIAVAISIFAAINKSKRNKLADDAPENVKAKPRNFFMDQLLGEDFLNEPIVPKAPPVQVKPATAYVAMKPNNDVPKQKYYHQVFKSTLPDRPKRETISTFKRQNEEEDMLDAEDQINYLEDFSLRKAVVYSIIMEQKY